MQSRLGMCALWLLGACAPAPELTTAALKLHALPSCELASPDSLVVRAAGDFPMQRRVLSGTGKEQLDGFPSSTRWLAVEAQAGGQRSGGLVALTAANFERGVLMLPLGLSCPLGDPLAVAAPGAAVAALADGGLLIAGGREASGAASARAVTLPAGAALVAQVAGGMLLRRAGATATRVDTRVVVVGGAPHDRGPAHETFEVYDAQQQRFDTARSEKLISGPRRDHGAGRLASGRVLIVGGRSELATEPLASAELIDLSLGKALPVAGALNVARVAPEVLVLDSGATWVALGTDATGRPVPEVERFDEAAQSFEVVARLPVHAHAAVAALEGERVFYLGCDGAGSSCESALILADGASVVLLDPAIDPELLASNGVHDLELPHLLELSDGRLLLSARDPTATIARRGFLLDLNTRSIPRAELSRVPERLLELDDGTRVELDGSGTSLGREEVESELDDPPEPVVGKGALHVVLDAPQHFEQREDGLVALVTARLDLPHFRFGDARIELELSGSGVLLLELEAAPVLAVELSATALAFGTCTLSRAPADRISLERRGAALELHSGGRSVRCDAPRLRGRTGVALRLDPGSRLTSLRVVRL